MTNCRVAIACTTEEAFHSPVSGHFGHCPYFTFVDLLDGRPIASRVVANPAAVDHRPGQVPEFVASEGASVILAGGMGRMAITLFDRLGIEVVTGATGAAGTALKAWLDGELTGIVPCRQSEEHHASGHHHHHHD